MIQNDTHMEIWEQETAALAPTEWERWIAQVESIMGHSSDGNQSEDGYSLDGFYDLWKTGMTPEEAIQEIKNWW